MFKKSRGSRRGIQQGVQKHQIKAGPKESKGILKSVENILPHSYTKQVHKFAEKLFNFYAKSSCTLALVPLSMDANGEFVPASKYKMVVHYLVLTFNVFLMLHKLGVSVHLTVLEGLNLSTLMCISTFLCYLVALSVGVSSVFEPADTISILKGMQAALTQLSDEDGLTHRTFENTKAAIVVVSVAILTWVISLVVPSFGFAVETLPVSISTIVENAGFTPLAIGMPRLVWKLLFWPLELALVIPTMLLSGWSGMILLTLAPTLQTCLQQLRKRRVESLDSRVELWRQFLALQVFNRCCSNWVKTMVVPTIFSISSIVVLCMYITIRHTEIPTYIYLLYPYDGISLLGMMFMVFYEVTVIIRSADVIIATLSSTEEGYFRDLPKPEKLYLIKLGKSTRSFSYPIGDFMDFSLDVPAGIWDEIVNLLLFLLTF